MPVNKKGILTFSDILKRGIYILFILALTSCATKNDTHGVEQYKLGNAIIKTQIAKTHFKLPDYINVKLSVETNEDTAVSVSINKSYKQILKLEHYNKSKLAGSAPDRILYNYKFTFLARKADTLHFSGFKIHTGKQFKLNTNKITFYIASAVNSTDKELKPVIKDLPLSFTLFTWIIILLIVLSIILYFKRKRAHKTQLPVEVDKKAELLKRLEALEHKKLSPYELDNSLNTFVKDMRPYIEQEAYKHFIKDWNEFFTQQSFAMDQSETKRRSLLIHYLLNHNIF